MGELRDPESAATAMKAAASGHTVLSTLHARDAVGTISVLRQWGMKSGPLATLLSVIVNQRLVRRLCSECKQEREPNTIEQEWFTSNGLQPLDRLWDAPGCERCNGTGIRGRIGIYEVWKLTQEDRHRIAQGDDVRSLTDSLQERNQTFLADAHREKLVAGEIRLSDVE